MRGCFLHPDPSPLVPSSKVKPVAAGRFCGELHLDIAEPPDHKDDLFKANGNPPAETFSAYSFRPVCLVLAITCESESSELVIRNCSN